MDCNKRTKAHKEGSEKEVQPVKRFKAFNRQFVVSAVECCYGHRFLPAAWDSNQLHSEAASHDRLGVALQHLKLRLIVVAPEPDIKSAAADVKIEQRQVREPLRQQRVDI